MSKATGEPVNQRRMDKGAADAAREADLLRAVRAARPDFHALLKYETERNSTLENSKITADNPADTDQPRITGEKDEGHVQGPLHDYFESRGVPQSIQPELAAAFDALVMARMEVAGRAPNASIKPPLPELTPKQIQAVMKRGEKRPWKARPTHRMDVFKTAKVHRKMARRGF